MQSLFAMVQLARRNKTQATRWLSNATNKTSLQISYLLCSAIIWEFIGRIYRFNASYAVENRRKLPASFRL